MYKTGPGVGSRAPGVSAPPSGAGLSAALAACTTVTRVGGVAAAAGRRKEADRPVLVPRSARARAAQVSLARNCGRVEGGAG